MVVRLGFRLLWHPSLSPAAGLLFFGSSAWIFTYDAASGDEFDIIKSACNKMLGQGENRLPVTVRAPAGSTHTTMPALHRFRCKVAQWRKRTAASLPLPLPLEVQLSILRECLVSKTPIRDHRLHRQGVSLRTLQVCRSWYREGKKIFWSENVFTISNSVRVVATFRDGHPVENLRQPTLAQAHQLAEEYGGEHCDFEYTTKGPDVPDAILAELVRDHRAREVFRSVCQPDRPKPAWRGRAPGPPMLDAELCEHWVRPSKIGAPVSTILFCPIGTGTSIGNP
jgi:hypothetical protein